MLEKFWQWLGWERRALDYADPALAYLYGGSRTSSGEPVNLDRALGLPAVWACCNILAGSIASMPLILYKRSDAGRERYVEHPLYDVLAVRPNPVQNLHAFWEALVTALLLRGNAYASITRDDDGRVRALWHIHPDRVQAEVLKNGRLRYKVTAGGQTQTLDANAMLHVTGPMSDDGYTGRSVITTFRETLGLGLALNRYGSEFFSNAATPRGTLTSPGRLSPQARENLKTSLEEQHARQGQRHRSLVLEEGMKWEAIAVSHEDAQFIESRRYSSEEVAMLFGVPPHLIGADVRGGMVYSNSGQESLHLLKHVLGPWLSRISSAVNFACIPALERARAYAEYLPDALLATDTKGRYEAYQIGVSGGWLTIDEIRAKENMPVLVERTPIVA
jgi:HK97 family phage portal protein